MIKKSIISLSMLVALCMLAACGGKNKKTLNVAAATTSIDTTGVIDVNHSCRVSVKLAYFKGNDKAAVNDSLMRSGIFQPDYYAIAYTRLKPQEVVKDFARRYVNDYHDVIKLITDKEGKEKDMKWYYVMTTHMVPANDDNVAYIANINLYEGGDGPMKYDIVRNINPKTGHIVTLADIADSGEQKDILDDVVDELMDRYDVDDINALQAKGVFAGIKPHLTDNFQLSDDEITFIYTPGEIAPMSTGEVKVTVDY